MLEFEMAQPWRHMPLAFVDVETTGLNTDTARIIEIGVFSVQSATTTERWTRLVDPERQIPKPASAVHGITDEMVEGHPSFREVVWEVYRRLRGRLLIAYNGLQFDVPVLDAEMRRCGLTMPIQPVLDPMLWCLRRSGSASVFPVSLATACRRLCIETTDAHRVAGDCEALMEFADRLSQQVPDLLGDLLDAQATWSQEVQRWRAERNARRRGLETARRSRQRVLDLSEAGPLDDGRDE